MPAPKSDPLKRFLDSLPMDMDKWRDGTGYDLAALDACSPEEQKQAERELLSHQPPDWRDIEALGRIDSDAARAAVKKALASSDVAVRREARRHVPADAVDLTQRTEELLKNLATAGFGNLDATINEAEAHHPPEVIDALLRLTLTRPGDVAVHYAALLYFLHGKSEEAFDWNHRPFFLRFHSTGADRKIVFQELCETIGVDAKKYLSARDGD